MRTIEPLGWQITVERPGEVPEVYNVAMLDDRQAVEAVMRVLGDVEGAVLKVKAKLTPEVFKALQMKPGDVLVGARSTQHSRRRPAKVVVPEAPVKDSDGVKQRGGPKSGKRGQQK